MLDHIRKSQVALDDSVVKVSGRPECLGLIGVGLVGGALTDRLLRHGFHVDGFDIDPGCLTGLAVLGGRAASSAKAVVSSCRRVLLSLPENRVVEAVLDEVEKDLRQGQVVIDTTTGSPAAAVKIGKRLAARGVAYLDASICGSSEELRKGNVLVVAGGPPDAFEACRDLFSTFARHSWRVGGWGDGLKMKLMTNLVLGLNRAVLAEGLAFGEALGLDPQLILTVLRAGPSYSRVVDLKGEKMVHGEFSPQARLSQHLKDVRLILAAGRETGLKLPLSELHEQLLEQAEAAGWGALDNSAIIRVYRPN